MNDRFALDMIGGIAGNGADDLGIAQEKPAEAAEKSRRQLWYGQDQRVPIESGDPTGRK
jgi:hypothetical protein